MTERGKTRDLLLWGALSCVAIVLLGKLALSTWQYTDYDSEARPAFDALAAGHVSAFLKLAPAYGGSMILRAPFAFIPKLWHGGELALFRAVAAPALIASAVLGIWVVTATRIRARFSAASLLALLLLVANPTAFNALQLGHPEELLGGVLAVAAVMLATREHPIWAGLLLGAAIANKEWALLAVGPVLLALPKRRVLTLLTAGATTALVLAPLALFSGGSFAGSVSAASATGHLFNPGQFWWFLGAHHGHLATGAVFADYRTGPPWVGRIAHPLIIALSLPLTALCAVLRSRGYRRPVGEPLLLLVLLLFLRCALDPWNNDYYILPCLLALATWEATERDGLPVISLTATFVSFVLLKLGQTTLGLSPDEVAAAFLIVGISAVAALMGALYRRVSDARCKTTPTVSREPYGRRDLVDLFAAGFSRRERPDFLDTLN